MKKAKNPADSQSKENTADKNEIQRLQARINSLEEEISELKIKLSGSPDTSERAIAIQETSVNGYFSLKDDSTILAANSRGAEMLGKERNALNGLNFRNLIIREFVPAFDDFMTNIFRLRKKSSCELRVLCEHHPPRHLYLEGVIFPDNRSCIVTANDISQYDRLQTELKILNESQYAELRLAHSAWWEIDLVTASVTFHENKAKMLGYPPEKFITYHDFTALLHPDDYDAVMEAMREHLRGKAPQYEADYRIKCSSGKYRWFKDIGHISEYNADGKPVKVRGLVFDMGEIRTREDEEELRQLYYSIFRYSGAVMLLIDPEDGKIRDVNNKAIEYYGYPRNQLLNMNISDISRLTVSELKFIKSNLTKVKSHYLTFQHYLASGEIRDVESYIGPLKKDGHLLLIFIIHDIMERKHLEDALRVAEERFRNIYMFSPVALELFDGEGKLIDINPAGCKLFGIEPENIMKGFNIFSNATFAPEKIEQLKQNKPFKYETIFDFDLIKKNEIFPTNRSGKIEIEVMVAPVLGPDKAILYYLVQIIDVTALKIAQQKLMESEANARAIMESTPDTLILIKLEGTIIDANEACAATFGYKRADILEKNIFDLLPAEVAKRLQEIMTEVSNSGAPYHAEEMRVNRWIAVFMYPVYLQGKKTDNVAIFERDVTKQKEVFQALKNSEWRYKMLTENMKDVLWTLDVETRAFTYISPSVEWLLGYTPEELTDRHIDEFIFPGQKENLLEMLESMNNDSSFNTGAYRVFEEELPCKNGSRIWAESIVYYWYNEQVGKMELQGVSRDISERKKMENALRESAARLQELSEIRDQLFSIISHDLRAPFNIFLSISEILISDHSSLSPIDIKFYGEQLHKSLQIQYDLLTDLLEWTRLQFKDYVFHKTKLFLHDEINTVFSTCELVARHKKIEFTNDLSTRIMVYADVNMLKLVLRNLLMNGLKFTSAGGTLNVSASDKDLFTEIVVADSGIGIAEKDLKNLFSKSVKVSTEGTDKEKGTGLGLLLCKEIIERHGGVLRAESELGKGSRFIFTLPHS